MAGIAATVVALGIIIAARLVTHFTSTALAATPAPLRYQSNGRSGRDQLIALAAAAARAPVSSQTNAPYAYVKTIGWYLDSRIAGDTLTSAVIPVLTESWTATDGSGRVLSRTLKASAGASLLGLPAGATLDDFKLAASSADALPALSTEPRALSRQLAIGHPTSIGPVERFVALHDLALREPIPPRIESVILRLLATSPGLINEGSVTDRLGRHGVAVSLDSAYSGALTRYTFIFDHTGVLLGDEETLLGKPGKLNVRPGAVIAYTVFVASGTVNSTTSRP